MITLKLLYGKKLGLPNYSSHEASACVETELRDLSEAKEQIDSLYSKLQESIDTQLKNSPGFTPTTEYGSQSQQRQAPQQNNQSQAQGQSEPDHDGWSCSNKQEQFIRRIMNENNLLPKDIDDLAHQRFGRPAPRLNKMQASGLIDALLDAYGTKGKGNQ